MKSYFVNILLFIIHSIVGWYIGCYQFLAYMYIILLRTLFSMNRGQPTYLSSMRLAVESVLFEVKQCRPISYLFLGCYLISLHVVFFSHLF